MHQLNKIYLYAFGFLAISGVLIVWSPLSTGKQLSSPVNLHSLSTHSFSLYQDTKPCKPKTPELPKRNDDDQSCTDFVSPVLRKILLCVTFHWNVVKLVYLESVLATAASYQTDVDILIVTDNGSSLSALIASWGWAHSVRVWEAKEDADERLYSLLWTHKNAIEEQLEHADYTTVIYLEDDTRLSWTMVISWAIDSEIMEPLGFTRCFYRTEVSPDTGNPNLLDWKFSHNITKFPLLDISKTNPSGYEDLVRRTRGFACGILRNGSSWPCTPHRYYVSPQLPFQGMWIATRRRLDLYMAHSYWNKTEALKAQLHVVPDFGYPERSNSLNILIDIPDGYMSTCLVPCTEEGREEFVLASVANVEHLRNGYSSEKGSDHGKLDATKAIVV